MPRARPFDDGAADVSGSITATQHAREDRPLDVLALLFGCGLWGLAWWPMKGLAARGLAGPTLAIVAYGAAALCLLPAVWRRRADVRGALLLLALIGVVGGVWNAAFMSAMVEGAASRVVLLYYGASGLAILGGRFLFREAIDGPRALAMALVFGGALLVLGAPEDGAFGRADLLALVAGLAHAITNLAFRGLASTPLVLKNFAMFVGAIAAAALATSFAVSSGASVTQGATLAMSGASGVGGPDGGVLLLGAAFGVGWLLLAESATQLGVSRLPATRSAVLLISELPITVVSASWIAGERLDPSALLGALSITLATWLEARRSPASTTVPASARRPRHVRD